MRIEWKETVKKSLQFSVNPKFWLPIFVCDLIFLLGGLLYLVLNTSGIASFLEVLGTGNAAAIAPVSGVALTAIAVFVVWMLVRLWIQGAIIHLSYKEKDYMEGFEISARRYPHILAFTIILTVLSILLGLVPELGTLFSLLVSIIFFFVFPAIILKKMGFWPAMKDSWELFKKHVRKFEPDINQRLFQVWLIILVVSALTVAYGFTVSPQPVLTLVSLWITIAVLSGLLIYSKITDIWALIGVIAFLILFVFLVPAFVITGLALSNTVTAMEPSSIMALLFMLTENVYTLAVGGAILLLGSAIGTIFSLKAMTEFYLQLKKKFKVL